VNLTVGLRLKYFSQTSPWIFRKVRTILTMYVTVCMQADHIPYSVSQQLFS